MWNGLRLYPTDLIITELSWEEFQENIIIHYGIVPLNIPTDCDSWGKKFLVSHALSCPKGGLILERNNYAAKEWVALSARALNPTAISYEPKINSRTLQGQRNGSIARVATGEQEGEENEGGKGETEQTMVTDQSWADVFVHGLWKWSTSALFDM